MSYFRFIRGEGLIPRCSAAGLLIIFVLAFPLTACISTSPGSPVWDASPAAMRQVFPDSEFIAQRGRGATRAAAEADGTAAIARFFNTELTSRIHVLEQYWEQNGAAQSISQVESELFIQTHMQIFGVRHAHDAHFDTRHGEWVTVAYINRNEAWQVYGPRFRQQAETFNRLFEASENESDPFRKALRYIAVQNHVRSPDFLNAQSMGELLHPARMDAEFALVRTRLAALPQRAADARRNAPVFIDISVDFESIVQSAFSRRFAALGFPVTSNRNAAAAVCRVTIEEGRQERQIAGFSAPSVFYNPHVQATVSSPAGTLVTFSTEGGQQSAVNPDVAKRRAYQALADRISNDFSLETNF